MTDEAIAHICHEAIRVYCEELDAEGENPETRLPIWELAPEWMRTSVEAGVKYLRENADLTAKDSHDEWRRYRKAAGWIHGVKKDEGLKQHPNMVDWDELPSEQRLKDVLFVAIVRSMDQTPSRIHLGGFRG